MCNALDTTGLFKTSKKVLSLLGRHLLRQDTYKHAKSRAALAALYAATGPPISNKKKRKVAPPDDVTDG